MKLFRIEFPKDSYEQDRDSGLIVVSESLESAEEWVRKDYPWYSREEYKIKEINIESYHKTTDLLKSFNDGQSER